MENFWKNIFNFTKSIKINSNKLLKSKQSLLLIKIKQKTQFLKIKWLKSSKNYTIKTLQRKIIK